VTAATSSDVIETNKTTTDVTVTSADVSHQFQSQDLDNYSIWTARMNEANTFLCLMWQHCYDIEAIVNPLYFDNN